MPDLTGFPALDVAIGLAFLFFLLSTVCSIIQEAISAFFGWRAKTLEEALGRMLGDEKVRKTVVQGGALRERVQFFAQLLHAQWWCRRGPGQGRTKPRCTAPPKHDHPSRSGDSPSSACMTAPFVWPFDALGACGSTRKTSTWWTIDGSPGDTS